MEIQNYKRLTRDTSNQVIAGVCAGLGKYLGIDPVVVRILFAVISLCYGGGIIIYLIMWLITPAENQQN